MLFLLLIFLGIYYRLILGSNELNSDIRCRCFSFFLIIKVYGRLGICLRELIGVLVCVFNYRYDFF